MADAQQFVPSMEFLLTTVPDSVYEMDSGGNHRDKSTNIHIKDRAGNVIQDISVYPPTYSNDGKVEEMSVSWLQNVRKVVRLEISHCPCVCDHENYYWLVTNEGEWVALPILTPPDYEYSLNHQEYQFSPEKPNLIELHEYQDEVILEEGKEPHFINVSDKVLKRWYWDGEKVRKE